MRLKQMVSRYRSPSGLIVEKFQYDQFENNRIKRKTEYSIILPGVSKSDLIRKLGPANGQIELEIDEAITNLLSAGIIKEWENSLEKRYVIVDGNLKALIKSLREMHFLEWQTLEFKLKFIAPPTYEESQWVASLKGRDDARRLLARWDHFRYDFNKLRKDETIFGRSGERLMQTWEQIKEEYQAKHEDFSKKLHKAIEGIFTDHRNTIKDYSFLIDVIGLLCPSVVIFMQQMDLTK